MCAPVISEEQLALLERQAELERERDFLHEQLMAAQRRESLLEAHIAELWHRADTDETLSYYLGKSDEEFPVWAEARVSM